MSTYSTELMELTRRLQRCEETLTTLQAFAAKGGHHRLSIQVEHTDQAVLDAIADIARRRLPAAGILASLIKSATEEVQRARLDIINRTLADSQSGKGNEQPSPGVPA